METTLNVNIGILNHITSAAESKRISRSELIAILIKKVMDENHMTISMGKLVKYQEKRSLENWHTFHLNLREDDYEYFLDLRKLFKMSVSLILAYAVEKYLINLDEIDTTDNYRFRNYVIIKEVVENIICWRCYWGYPPNLENNL
jgi:hypothetical protein